MHNKVNLAVHRHYQLASSADNVSGKRNELTFHLVRRLAAVVCGTSATPPPSSSLTRFLPSVGDAWTLIRVACFVENVPYGRCGFPCDWLKRCGFAFGSLRRTITG